MGEGQHSAKAARVVSALDNLAVWSFFENEATLTSAMSQRRDPETSSDALPVASQRLLQAAAAGLLAFGLLGCHEERARVANATGEITSTKTVDLDEAGFKALCDERNGTVEVMPHCGGFATAPGFSYDTTTQVLAEHTCKGANTCAGWNCVTDS